MGSWYVMWWCVTLMPTSWWNPVFPSSGLEGKKSHTLRTGAAGPPNCLGLSTKPHGVTSCDYSQQTEVPITYYMPRF